MQRADVWYVPDPAQSARLGALGLLGRMATGPCLFEPFHQAPDVAEVLDCLRKQLTLQYSATGQARWRTTPAVPPVVWVLAAGRPDGALRGLGMIPLAGWPTGIYAPAPALQGRVVVIRELPAVRATLLVRLMGAGRVLRDAIEELKAMPEEALERDLAVPRLIQLRMTLPGPSERTDEQQELAMNTLERYERWKQRITDESLERGIATGMERGIATGLERGLAPLVRLFERRLDRALTEAEHTVLRQRLDPIGAQGLGDAVFDMDAPTLAAWIAEPTAR